jgi:hypothetical protein
MEQKNIIKEKAKELFVDESQMKNQVEKIIELVKGKIKIYEKTGEPFLLEPEKYSNREKIFLVIVGFFISNESGVIDSPLTDINSIGEILGGIPNTTLSAPLKNLVDMKIILRINSNYQLNKQNYLRVVQMLEELNKNGRK